MPYDNSSFYTANMSPEQCAWFYNEYGRARRDEAVGVIFALLLGCFGAHHFYLRRTALGVLYLVFFWTGITAIIGFVECFFMPGRVRDYNAVQAASIANHILGSSQPTLRCSSCGVSRSTSAIFCPHCGAPVTAEASVQAQASV